MNSIFMKRYVWRPFAIAALVFVGACDDPAPQVAITGTGSLEGLLFFDQSEDGVFDPSDGDYALNAVDLDVRNRGTEQSIGAAQTGTDGRFTIASLPLGTHDLFVDTLDVPAGISICQNPLRVSIYLDEAQFSSINGRPGCLITIATAKELPNNEFAIVQGIVTSSPGQIEASFAYIEDQTAGLFLFAPALMGQGIAVGDRIEVGGNVTVFSGQFELTNVVLRTVEVGVATPTPRLVTTAEIAASGPDPFDDLQNRFVRIEGAELTAAFGNAPGGNLQNGTVDDGSGAITIRVDDGLADRNTLNSIFTAGACYDINGFAANFNGAAQIFPRSLTAGLASGDIVEVTCP